MTLPSLRLGNVATELEIAGVGLEPVAKLTAEEAVTDHGTGQEHQRFMRGRILLLPGFQFSKLMQPGQGSFYEPACLAETAPMGGAAFSEDGLYPLFLSSLRWGSESKARSP